MWYKRLAVSFFELSIDIPFLESLIILCVCVCVCVEKGKELFRQNVAPAVRKSATVSVAKVYKLNNKHNSSTVQGMGLGNHHAHNH